MKKLSLLILLTFLGCQENNNLSPESALQSFVEERMGKVVERDFLLERVAGKLKENVQNMSEEDFKKFADLRQVKNTSFKILSKSCQEKKCFMTYSIAYHTNQEDQLKFQSEVKKIAELAEIQGKWLIVDVSNVKTYHEAMEPISP
jgi:hypothetical protein